MTRNDSPSPSPVGSTASTRKSASLIDALLPVVVLILLLALSVYLFGDDSSSGANQIALMLGGGLATLIGLKNGYRWADIEAGVTKGMSLTLGAFLILFSIGALIGTWLLAGTVPSMIYFGLQLLNPDLFYVSSCILCAVVALCIGSSWTVAATIGVALIGVATGMNLSPVITAGAIVSGAYFGDKLSPLSDTTNLAPAIAGADLFSHIRHMLWSTVPAFLVSLLLFTLLGLQDGGDFSPERLNQLTQGLEQHFALGWHLLLPLVITLGLALAKVPAFAAISIGAIVGGFWALLFQQQLIANLAAEGPTWQQNVMVIWQALYQGVSIDTGNSDLNDLVSGGGMGSMLGTVWLIMTAMYFGSVMETTGLLKRLVEGLIAAAHSGGRLIVTTIFTAFGVNVISADQYISVVMPARMFKGAYGERDLAPENLSRAIEDGGTVTSALIPWNTCGAYMHSVLGVGPLEYALYAFFNWLSPLVGIVCALFGWKVLKLPQAKAGLEQLQQRSTGNQNPASA
ncbi:Na+/H+ antiporter NhaC [Ferrimonas aestuarii]|uniref:Na+/H+ antiporter NhaC n=1 Tax=Ferrimonas aestuarii TaxID=2569539 RepID=A0A4U1BT88_9GAMM|nr:Na+/H+ antiporter NhaC [Ferrimonas aestuarii]TKB58676.1 Na+/H+ antiporter NhaC [Ferrimonas aestuarii]